MKLHKSLVGLAIAGSLAVGVAGVAGAQTSSGDLTAPTAHVLDCSTATARLAKAQDRIEAGKARIAQVEARIAQLRSNGHDERADKLAARLAHAVEKLGTAEARLGEVTAKVEARCAAAPTDAS